MPVACIQGWSRLRLGLLITLCGSFAHAQTTQPASPSSKPRESFDLSTSKTLTGDWGGLRTDLADLGFKLELSYQQQFQQNFRGGLRTHNGHRFSGSYDLVTKFDFEKMGLIDNAGFYFKAKGAYSDGINPAKVGASGAARVNSDACGDYPIYVNKWWYWHTFLDNRIELRLGVLETNKDLFDLSPYADHEDKDFINRLSIRNATIPHGTGMGAYLKIEPVDWAYMIATVIDAQARARRTQFDTAFHDEDWFVGIWEFGLTPKWNTAKGAMPGRYRVGFWYDPTVRTVFRNTLGGRCEAPTRGDDLGFYLGADQMVFKENDDPKDSQGLGLYARYGYAHRDVHKISHYWSAGASYQGLIPTRDKDVMAFGVSQAIYSSQYRHESRPLADRETVYEWYYKCYVTPWLDISPDLQIVTNPGGDRDDRDAIVAGVRIRVIF